MIRLSPKQFVVSSLGFFRLLGVLLVVRAYNLSGHDVVISLSCYLAV